MQVHMEGAWHGRREVENCGSGHFGSSKTLKHRGFTGASIIMMWRTFASAAINALHTSGLYTLCTLLEFVYIVIHFWKHCFRSHCS